MASEKPLQEEGESSTATPAAEAAAASKHVVSAPRELSSSLEAASTPTPHEAFSTKKKRNKGEEETDEKNDNRRENKGESSTKKQTKSTCENNSNNNNNNQKQQADWSAGSRRVAPSRQPRPIRPNLRRQVIVRGETSTSVPVITAGGRPIELATVLPAGAISMSGGGPPKRPAYLPPRYMLKTPAGSVIPPPATAAAVSATSGAAPVGAAKPNRYAAWAQVQHWQAAAAAAAAAREQQVASTLASGADGLNRRFQNHFSSAASRVLVVNPMHIVNLSKHTKSRLIKSIEGIKKFSEKWFSHVLLLLFLAIYACIGAYVFISFEAPTESWEKQYIINSRLKIVNESWSDAILNGKSKEEFSDLLRLKLEDYERILNRACASGMSSSSLENQWNFWGALFYSMTVFTTIGYGHLTPITFGGRVATMVYAIFGIPILLMVLADLGKLLTRIIKFSFKKFRFLYNKLFKKNETSQRTKKLITDNTNQYIGFAKRGFERGMANYIQPNYQRIPKAASLLRGKIPWFHQENNPQKPSNSTQNQPEQPQPQPQSEQEQNQEDRKIDLQIPETPNEARKSISSDVIITPHKQSKPVSPVLSTNGDPGSAKHPLASGGLHHPHHAHHSHQHHSHNHHSHQHHAHSAGRLQVGTGTGTGTGHKRKTSLGAGSASSKSALRNLSNNIANNPPVPHPKGSLSRSSSSSLLVQQGTAATVQDSASNVNETPAHPAPPLSTTSSDYPAAVAAGIQAQPLPVSFDGLADLDTLSESDQFVDDEEIDDDEEEDFDIPVSFAVFLLIVYMMFGAVVFSIWEGWNFFDSLYFVFISMSTIGFGDLVPQHPKRMIGTFIYLLFGLALTSMCINVVQEKIHATFLRAKMQIGEKMGFDLDQIMADDYYGSMEGACMEEDCESHSLAMDSQTNSSLIQVHHNNQHSEHLQFGEDASPKPDQSVVLNTKEETISGAGIKHSKSKESLRLKKRNLASLPGHNNLTASGVGGQPGSGLNASSFRRKYSSKRREASTGSSRQSTTIAPAPLAQPQSATTKNLSADQAKAIESPRDVVRSKQPVFISVNEPVLAIITSPSPQSESTQLDLTPKISIRGICEPLPAAAAATLTRQRAFGAGPTRAMGQMVKSRSSESPMLLAAKPYRCDISTSAAAFRASNAVLASGNSSATTGAAASNATGSSNTNAKQQQQQQQQQMLRVNQSGRRSAGSSRRSSVSQELNQLDDLISVLKSQASEETRFGPLLGISRSNSRH